MKINARTSQALAKFLIWTSAVLVIVVLLAIILFILIKGLPVIDWQFLTQIPRNMGRDGGISSSIVGTLLVTAVAVLVATPFGVGTAFYLTEFTHESRITRIIRFISCS